MSRERPQDPVHPTVTFDNYVIPETVQTQKPEPLLRMPPRTRQRRKPAGGGLGLDNPTLWSAGVIAMLTFVLGVMATVKITGQRGPLIAERSAPQEIETYAPVVSLQPPSTVTRSQSPDLLGPSTPLLSADPQVPALETAVLKGLQPKRTVGKLTPEEMAVRAREAQAIVSRNKLRMLREGVLAGVYSVKAHTDNAVTRLVLETVNAEMSRQSMGNLLLEAALKGDIEVPAALSTADGDIDMDTMLFNLIQTSLAEDGTPEGTEAALEMSRRAFAASSAKTRQVKGERIYTVQPGDSLAYLSLQFYGRPNAYLRIFEANRQILSSPDKIQVGQRLKIPG